MLSELLMDTVQVKGNRPKPDRPPGISCSSLFPCPYFLYRVHIGRAREETLTGQQILNMDDGWDAEEQSVRRLKDILGVNIKDRQAHVTVGRSSIPGHIDGTVTEDKKRLWEHKAWGSSRYDWFVSKGIEAYPGEKTQVNAYMLGMGLDECVFFVKKKESNDYHSPIVKLDKTYILPILDWADRIRLEGWIPEPQLTKRCSHCGINCFGQVMDFSWIKEANSSEMAKKWLQGKKLVDVGGMLMEEARTVFVGTKDGKVKGLIGDEDLLLVDGIKVLKVTSRRFDIRRDLVLKEFGPEGLYKVGEDKTVVSYRITETGEE